MPTHHHSSRIARMRAHHLPPTSAPPRSSLPHALLLADTTSRASTPSSRPRAWLVHAHMPATPSSASLPPSPVPPPPSHAPTALACWCAAIPPPFHAHMWPIRAPIPTTPASPSLPPSPALLPPSHAAGLACHCAARLSLFYVAMQCAVLYPVAPRCALSTPCCALFAPLGAVLGPAPPSSDHVVLHLALPSRASRCLRAVAPLSHITPLSHVAPLPPSSHSFCASLARPRAPQRRRGHAATRRHVCGRDGAHICGCEMAGLRKMEHLGAGVRSWAREA
ncbi:hypothetical protein DENSPDRAFT_885465 [Dentipellis sp. KUC8613]|nr:hypothetical protein DENSPDRAFT_885465 [Dentipellis sp. KUC8613]